MQQQTHKQTNLSIMMISGTQLTFWMDFFPFLFQVYIQCPAIQKTLKILNIFQKKKNYMILHDPGRLVFRFFL